MLPTTALSAMIIQICHCNIKAAIENTCTNKRGYVPIKLGSRTLKFQCHIICVCDTNYYFSQQLKNVETVLSLLAIQKQVVGQIGPMGCNMLTWFKF